MKGKRIFILTLFILPLIFGFTRVFYLDEEFKKSTNVVEVIIRDYTSRTDTLPYQEPKGIEKVINDVSYSYVDSPDSIYKYKPPYTGYVNATPYYHIRTKENFDPMVPEGYWPTIGDTVLVVFNEYGQVSLFADILKGIEYKFWSPYHTSSWNTQFYGKYPFRADTTEILNKSMYDHIQTRAKNSGYDFASFFHCRVDKVEFWKFYKKIKE